MKQIASVPSHLSAARSFARLITAVRLAVPAAHRVSDRLVVRLAACGLLVGILAAILWWAVDLLAHL